VAANETKLKKRKIAWGITGAGDRIAEFVQVMKEMKKQYEDIVEIQVFTSKAAEIVLKYYRVEKEVKQSFEKVTCEVNSNSPFLAPWMQTHKYEFLLIAPASSNTVAKIAYGIGDTLLTNAAIMGLKAFIPLYIVPSDFEEKIISSNLPNGKEIKLRIRKEDAENTRKLEGTLTRVISESQTKNLPVNNDLIKNILGKTLKKIPPSKKVLPEEILKAVAGFYNLKISQLKGDKRDKVYSFPRQILYYLLRTEAGVNLKDIGEFLGGRDHTTILHGIRKISNLLSTDNNLRGDVMGIKNELFV